MFFVVLECLVQYQYHFSEKCLMLCLKYSLVYANFLLVMFYFQGVYKNDIELVGKYGKVVG